MEASSLSHSPSSTEQTRQSEFIINVRLILTAEIIKDAISKVLADAQELFLGYLQEEKKSVCLSY